MAYLRIENELISLMRERENKESLVSVDYEYALLSPAIERVAGNTLTKINDDNEFKIKLHESEKLYTRWYYFIAYQYRLPTLRIVPFILRLINLA